MLKIKLDTTHIDKVIIIFKNRMSLNLSDIVQVFISINITKFYIINTFILFFFFYLKKINTFNIYFNNIINQFIC